MGWGPQDLGVMCYIGEINTGVPPGLGSVLSILGNFRGEGVRGCINPCALSYLMLSLK